MLSSLLKYTTAMCQLSKQLVMLNMRRNTVHIIDSAIQHARQFHGLRIPAVVQPLCAAESTLQLGQVRTFKMKTRLKLRCESCYFVRYGDQQMVLCRTHQRHKQMKLKPKPETKWILTHATQGTPRQW